MSWAKENKFLTGYGIVMLLGAGALGFKVYTASSAYEEANTRYTTKASSYNSLRRLAPFPNRENLAQFEAQKKEAAAVITAFQAELAKREFPVQPMSPEQFQDMLKKAVTDVRAKGTAANVTFKDPNKFYLGFDRYEKVTPDKDAAALLGRDLKAIEWVVDQLIATPIIEVKEIKRPDIPEEKSKTGAAAATTPKPPQGAAARPAQPNLVNVHTFDITFTCKQHQLAKALNTIISPNAPQFFIPRTVRILNSNPKPPPRVDPNANAPVPPPPVPPVPGQPPVVAEVKPAEPPVTKTYLLGEEIVEATLRLEIVDFTEPAAPATPATPAPK